jgi:heme-degrading monooxygenase HmoA
MKNGVVDQSNRFFFSSVTYVMLTFNLESESHIRDWDDNSEHKQQQQQHGHNSEQQQSYGTYIRTIQQHYQ